ncbi:MAG: hypothetical protein ACMUIU_07855 [bacterium]
MKIEAIRIIPGVQIHYSDKKQCVGSRNLDLVQSPDRGITWGVVCRLPVPAHRSLLMRSDLYRRLVRGGIHSVLPIENADYPGYIVVAEGQIYWISSDGRQVKIIFQIRNGSRPLRRGICVIGNKVIMGEYWGNENREPVSIYCIHMDYQRIENCRIERLYQFKKNSIRHIHAIQQDPFSNQLWISTGDNDSECMIAVLNRKTAKMEVVGIGSQKWRTLSFAFRPQTVYWGTDNHLGENRIWCLDRLTGVTKMVGKVTGPVYYNACMEEYIIFGTTMEKGEAQQDGFGRLYAVDLYGKIEEVWKKKKDIWNARLFGYGVFEFAEGHPDNNRFWVTTKGFKGRMRSILFEIRETEK